MSERDDAPRDMLEPTNALAAAAEGSTPAAEKSTSVAEGSMLAAEKSTSVAEGGTPAARIAAKAESRGPSVADHVGEAAGGIGGVFLGAGIGSAAGPIGTLIGGIAGAIGGWWTGRALSEAAANLTTDDELGFRAHYESSPRRIVDLPYEDVADSYRLGYIASHNPNFLDQTFEEIEPELGRGWTRTEDVPVSWAEARDYASEGYRIGVERRSFADRRTGHRPDEVERRSGSIRRDEP